MTLRVGLIGCGRIAREGHLPAYRKAGIPVVAVCDLDPARAATAGIEYGAEVEAEGRSLAARGDVDVVDIVTRPDDRADLIRSLLPLGKPLLVQKPFLYDLVEAKALAREVREAGVMVAVNHNARWAPPHACVKEWVEAGEIGPVYALHHLNRFNEDLTAWYTDHPDYLFVDHGIHYLDLVRYLTGRTPTSVSATRGWRVGQRAHCALVYAVTLRFEDGGPLLVASLSFNNAAPAPGGFHYRLDLDGSRASATASLDEAKLIAAGGETLVERRFSGAWIPDGLIGAFNALAQALATRTEPPHSLDDHLLTLAVAKAAARSARASGSWVEVAR